MQLIWRCLGAILVALVFAFLLGYFEFRRTMLESGVIVSWDLIPLRATAPAVAYLEIIAMGLVFGVAAFVFLARRRGVSGDTGIPALVGGLLLLGLIGWQLSTATYALVLPVELHETAQTFGWAAAVRTAGLSSATLGMAVLLLVIAMLRYSARGTSAPSRVHG